MGNPSWRFEGNERKYVEEVLLNGFRAGADGTFKQRLEMFWAKTHNSGYGVASNSGTSALHIALLALGVGPGDEVLTPALTPLMCGLTPHYTGATPVYVDSDPNTFLMDPKDLESKITPKTKAIIVVHMYGAVCNLDEIIAISKKHDIPFIEDCAQCVWGSDHKGRISGTSGAIGCWSFENSKQLTCGDGGMSMTKSEDLAVKMRKIGGLGYKTLTASSGGVRTDRDKFQSPTWERFDTIGFNYRMSELGAAVALAQAEKMDKYVGLRRAMGDGYRAVLSGSELLIPQFQPKGYTYTNYTFSAKFCGEQYGIKWHDFRKKYMENGGDGIFAASQLLYNEPVFRDNKIGRGRAPVAEGLQKCLMNFTTNQANAEERMVQLNALTNTLRFFGEK